MALVKQLDEINMERNSVHGEVEATFTVFRGDSGKRYLQIDTYGSRDRAIPGKKSQSIQFDDDSVRQLKAILDREFRNV